MTSIRAAVLTVSDTASLDATADKSGPTIKEILNAREGYECVHTLIVPDEKDRIQEAVKGWCSQSDIDIVFTTGGTGFSGRDVTPEAIKVLLDREAVGIVHLLLSASLQHTPMAALSRPVAGTVGNTLVVTFPGSVKAVKENLAALMQGGILGHLVEYLRGGEGREVHAQLAKAGGITPRSEGHDHDHHHHHHHHHHHEHEHNHSARPGTNLSHDPSAPVSTRHRISPYPAISLQDALGLIEKNIIRLESQTLPVNSSLRGHVLAVDVHAPQNVPPTQTTSHDGYALRATDKPGTYKVLTSQTHALSDILPSGSIYRINTGGPLPAGTDSVIMVEDTRLISTIKDPNGALDGEEDEVETLVEVSIGESVRAPGSDVQQGALVLQKGERINSSGGEIGTLSFVGRREVEVYKKPVVALLSTGNEIVDLASQDQSPPVGGWGGIFDTNRPSLQATLEGMGYGVIDLGIVPDNIDAHVAAIQRGLDSSDILLTTGGTSMGPSDLLKPVIERQLNGTVHFGRVSVKPGKPTTFATIPWKGISKPMFALPGNPASALVTFQIFVVPALRMLGGWPRELFQLPRVPVQLQSAMSLDPRPEFHRVIIKVGRDGLKAFSTGGQRSSRVASLSGANGLVALPSRTTGGPARLEAGSTVEAVVIGELQML